MGKRNNKPAQFQWFVPGGRILKSERIDDAFRRLVSVEIGADLELRQAKYVGLYDHFYPDSIWGDEVSTHYVVNAFEIQVDLDDLSLPQDQHNQYAWFSIDALLNASDVHDHTKWYFLKGKEYS